MTETTPRQHPNSSIPPGAPSVCPPWDQANPEYVQAVAEDLVLGRLDELPRIIGIVRDSEVPPSERIGYPAYTPLNFYDNLADETNPDSFLDGLDLAAIRGELPEDPEGPGWTMWRLPGHGSGREKYQCGRFLVSKTYGCPEGHELHAVRCGCNRLDCPVCWPDKVRRNADHIRRRLNVTDQLYNGLTWYHVTVSPPQGPAIVQWGTPEGYKRSKKECLDVLRRAGALGGVMVCHPYRNNKDGSDLWRAGPHFHAIMNGWIDGSKIPAGWVVKNIRKLDISEVFPVAYYLCSHAGVGNGGVNRDGRLMSIKSVSYFGNCGTNNGDAPAKLREEMSVSVMKCCTCDLGQYRYRDYLGMLRGYVSYVPPLESRATVTAWCIRSDLDGLRSSSAGLDLESLPLSFGSRVFVEYPESVRELTSSDIGLIDGELSIETNTAPRGRNPGRCPVPAPRELPPGAPAVGVVPSSPGPGGGPRTGSPGVAGHV